MDHLSRSLVLGCCGASILACILRAHRIYLLLKQGPGTGHATEILSTRRHYHFLVIAHTFISLSAAISFGVLALVDGDGSLMVASGSVVLLSMIGQCCWSVGFWYTGQRSFHPGTLVCTLAPSLFLFLTGVILAENWPSIEIAIAPVASVSAGWFRIWMTWEWTVLIWEARGYEGRPGGNTFRNTPKISQMLGHLVIQILSTLSIVAACSVVAVQLNGSDPGSSPSLIPIISVIYVSHDAFTEIWMLANKVMEALRRWLTPTSSGSTDEQELTAWQSEDWSVI